MSEWCDCGECEECYRLAAERNAADAQRLTRDLAALRTRLTTAEGILRLVNPTAPALRDAIDAFLTDSPATPAKGPP